MCKRFDVIGYLICMLHKSKYLKNDVDMKEL